ncbi:hypothetical protein M501DRAFT_942603 [Patellaria atrata CBS 101060]|uniref:CENP-V/GFA domain-containing protein n=1 Tax=Patellaria atrata CBS 101060 TaxID=1346257 RepID=A0A9P4S522_9PEZI|nr:hypothetical protein M501DRAFT_942603 [Patellaria atrata CBS 101060]
MEVSCQCGACHFTTPTAEPLNLYHCHCVECRKQSASAFGTSAIFERFDLPSDQPISCWTRPTDSGNILDCFFCSVCGVRLVHARKGGTKMSVKGGCIEGLDWKKAKHIWTCRAVVDVPAEAQQWEKEP